MDFIKLHVSIRTDVHEALNGEAQRRGVTIQELVRAVVLPEWIAHVKPVETTK